jgi:hypothetical protein
MRSLLHKFQLASKLGLQFGLRTYLEIATATTGHEFKFVDTHQFTERDRLLYYCPDDWTDGFPVTFRTPAPSSRQLEINKHYDMVFVDPWHEYQNSLEDIDLALRLVAPGGLVLIHDCSPPDAEYALPQLPPMNGNGPGICNQPWSGVTYAAYLDRVLDNNAISYITFDTDHGCGLVSRDHPFRSNPPREEVKALWRHRTAENQYQIFDAYRAELLRLRPPRKARFVL